MDLKKHYLNEYNRREGARQTALVKDYNVCIDVVKEWLPHAVKWATNNPPANYETVPQRYRRRIGWLLTPRQQSHTICLLETGKIAHINTSPRKVMVLELLHISKVTDIQKALMPAPTLRSICLSQFLEDDSLGMHTADQFKTLRAAWQSKVYGKLAEVRL